MRSLVKLLKNSLYIFPRLVLFGIFVLCFVITVLISLDIHNPYESSINKFRVKVIRTVKSLAAEIERKMK